MSDRQKIGQNMNSLNTSVSTPSIGAATERNFNNVHLGYALSIAVGVLVLVSTATLVLYVCVKVNSIRLARTMARSGVEAHHHRREDIEESGISIGIRGLDQTTLETYPTLLFTPDSNHKDTSCSICLADYKESDELRCIPGCLHSFHTSCIDQWLRLHASCPMCRTSPLPTPQTTPGSTPLSELIPLAIHPLWNR